MEFKIISPGADGFIKAIEWNNEEIKAEMAAKVADYKMMVYSDDQIKDAKKDRAVKLQETGLITVAKNDSATEQRLFPELPKLWQTNGARNEAVMWRTEVRG